MKKLLTTLFLAIVTLMVYAQPKTYEEVARKCTSDFQDGLTSIPADSIEKVIVERMNNLRQCFIGLKFPDFNLTSIDGKQYKLSDLKGKVVMLNFWFISCAPCVAEMPLLNELADEYRDKDFVLLTFSTDNKESILNFRKRKPLDFVIFDKSKQLIENTFYLSFGYPTNIFLDKEGKIVEFKLGGHLEEEKLRTTKTEFKEIIETEMER